MSPRQIKHDNGRCEGLTIVGNEPDEDGNINWNNLDYELPHVKDADHPNGFVDPYCGPWNDCEDCNTCGGMCGKYPLCMEYQDCDALAHSLDGQQPHTANGKLDFSEFMKMWDTIRTDCSTCSAMPAETVFDRFDRHDMFEARRNSPGDDTERGWCANVCNKPDRDFKITEAQSTCADAGLTVCTAEQLSGARHHISGVSAGRHLKGRGAVKGYADYYAEWAAVYDPMADDYVGDRRQMADPDPGVDKYVGQHVWTRDGTLKEAIATAAVRCCGLEGQTMPMSEYGCSGAGQCPECRKLTWEEANAKCTDHGLRLCSGAEAHAGTSAGTGCGMDSP